MKVEVIYKVAKKIEDAIQKIIDAFPRAVENAIKEINEWSNGNPPTEDYEYWGRICSISELLEVIVKDDEGTFITQDVYHIDENGGSWWEYGDKVIAWREIKEERDEF